MVKIREKQTEQLEKAASKGLKLGGWKKMTLSSKIAAVVLVLVALTAILAPLLAPYSPVEIFTARQAPGNGFIFGTDDKGRDILSRMLYGGRYSLIIGFGATAMALVCGSVVGALAAVSRKSVSEAIMRILDIIMSIPGIALAALLDKRAADGSLADCPLFRVLDAQARGRAFSLPVLQLNTDGHAAPSGNVPIGGANHAA